MKYLTIFLILICSVASASSHNMAMIQDGVIQNVAVWDDVSPWNPGDQYKLIDITLQPQLGIGYTCIKCDGTDFTIPQNN